MSAQDLEQRARELLAAEYERDGKIGSANHIRTQSLLPNKARAVRAIVAALCQQPAPVVPALPGSWPEDAGHENGNYECRCSQCGAAFYGHKRRVVCRVCAKPAPVVDDAVRELIQKWRKDADDDLDCLTSWKLVRRRCADELEAAIARAQGVQS